MFLSGKYKSSNKTLGVKFYYIKAYSRTLRTFNFGGDILRDLYEAEKLTVVKLIYIEKYYFTYLDFGKKLIWLF